MLDEPTKKECDEAIKILKKAIDDNAPDILILDSWSSRKGTIGVVKLQYCPYPRHKEQAKKIVDWFRGNVSGKLFDEIKKELLKVGDD